MEAQETWARPEEVPCAPNKKIVDPRTPLVHYHTVQLQSLSSKRCGSINNKQRLQRAVSLSATSPVHFVRIHSLSMPSTPIPTMQVGSPAECQCP